MGTDGGFRMQAGQHEKIQEQLDAAAHKRIQKARTQYPPIDYNANHTADTLFILFAVLGLLVVVAAAVLRYTDPALGVAR